MKKLTYPRVLALTALTMVAFAGNSLLCRAALGPGHIDAASFTSVRLIAGALVLWLIVQLRTGREAGKGSWWSALALFIYAAGFSYAYISLPASIGPLLLFGAVQATMIGYGLWRGERLQWMQWTGLVMAFGGLIGLLLPGVTAPPLPGSLLMLGAGIAWGVYSLRGRGAGDPLRITAGNFLRTVPIALILSALTFKGSVVHADGFGYAVASGALASGLGYAIWYTVLPFLKAASAASVQLSVPVIAAVGGVLLLGEHVTLRLVLASIAILGGIALVILEKRPLQAAQSGADKSHTTAGR